MFRFREKAKSEKLKAKKERCFRFREKAKKMLKHPKRKKKRKHQR